MPVTVLRVELSGRMIESMRSAAPDASSIGIVVAEALRSALPELAQRTVPPSVRSSETGIAIHPEQPSGLAALRRIAEHTPPPARFTETVQLAIPAELWNAVDQERTRLGIKVADLIAWAWRRR